VYLYSYVCTYFFIIMYKFINIYIIISDDIIMITFTEHCYISNSSSGDLSLPTAQLVDLKPGTAYFVRIVSKNDNGRYGCLSVEINKYICIHMFIYLYTYMYIDAYLILVEWNMHISIHMYV
jgi:hypothetical protein